MTPSSQRLESPAKAGRFSYSTPTWSSTSFWTGKPHVDVAAKLLALVDNGRMEGSICATTATTIYYIAAKSFGRKRAHAQVHELLTFFEVAPVDRDVLDRALDLDFANATLPVFDPRELLAAVAAASE